MASDLDFDPATGIIKGGRFVGRHIDEVMKYIDALESQEPPPNNEPPPPPPAPPKELTEAEKAAAKLAEEAAKRLTPMDQLALTTAESVGAQDEANFSATVSDYEKYRPKITEMKKNTHISIRTQNGFHKQAYLFVKGQDPEMQELMLGTKKVAPATEEPEPPVPTITDPMAHMRPKAAPGLAVPSASDRGGKPEDKKPKSKLKANDKIMAFVESMGYKDVNEYLLIFESRGGTQHQLDDLASSTKTREAARRKTVYDR